LGSSCSRTPHQIARAANDDLFICRQLSGVLALEQDGRDVLLEAGDITLVDPLLPYVGKFSCVSSMLVLKVPRRALEARIGRTPEMVVRSIKPSDAEGGLTSSYLAMLPAYTGRMCPTAEEIVKNQALDLVAMSLAKAIGAHSPGVSSAHVRAATEAGLTDPAVRLDDYQPWLNSDLFFLIDSLRHGKSLAEVASFLRKDEDAVREKAKELKLTQ
jgi:hypothetical protein